MPCSIRDTYAHALVEVGAENDQIIVLDADVSSSTRSLLFGEKYPDRFLNCGIAESNMVSMAAGLARGGKIVFVNTFACFMTTNGLLSMRSLIAYSNLNVKLMGAYGGLSDAYDGATHHSIDDLAIARALPGMTVAVASDQRQTRFLVHAAVKHKGPVYLRLSRDAMPDLPRDTDELALGKGSILRRGRDVTIVACGAMCAPALEAAEELAKRHIDARVVDMFTIKPMDEALLLRCASETGAIVTAEEHSVIGGLGSAVAETLARACLPTPMAMVGIQDVFTESGAYGSLLHRYGVDSCSIVNAVEKINIRRRTTT